LGTPEKLDAATPNHSLDEDIETYLKINQAEIKINKQKQIG
jgi:hypothetical protein